MRLIINDLEDIEISKILPATTTETVVISKDATIKHCIGCFGCWIKTPGACVIRDKYGDMGEYLSKCESFVIVSKCIYGGFSPFIKNLLDRSISYVHPYFIIKNGEMHHRLRYKKNIDMQIWFYGDDITQEEQTTAQNLVKANAINLNCNVSKVKFVKTTEELEGQVL